MKAILSLIITATLYASSPVLAQEALPRTGISGIYEVMTGVRDAGPAIEYFAEFGFRVVAQSKLSAAEAKALYGVDSALSSYRLQNGEIDSHGLLRILEWERPISDGVGYAPPSSIGQRIAVMRTRDVIRIYDVYKAMYDSRQPWLPLEPIFDDPVKAASAKVGEWSIKNRRTGVREMTAYGTWFNHLFFQRYGYDIPGYGTIGKDAPLQTSEFTHHSFLVKGDISEITRHYSEVLGMRSEEPPFLKGDWRPGTRQVLNLSPGETWWYRGFVSPNNICGKLKFYARKDLSMVPDRSAEQKVGAVGITLHSFYVSNLGDVHRRARDFGLDPTSISKNEFGEQSFLFTGPDGVSWQILEDRKPSRPPVQELKYQRVNN